MNWQNLYADREGEWLKGNLHAHTILGSSRAVLPEECLDRYVELGYDYLCVSDHRKYTHVEDDRLTIIPGFEWNSDIGQHTGIYSTDTALLERAVGIKDHTRLLQELAANGALTIINHPNQELIPHFRREELDVLPEFHGLEIYNAVVNRQVGPAISTDKWDYLLCQGRKILGFANDDSHLFEDIGHASNVVRCKSRQPGDILAALKSGNFYASGGVMIDDIRREGNIIEVETKDAQEIWAIVDGGGRVECVKDSSIRFDVSKYSATYIRFDLFGKGSQMAWTQPFFIN